MCLHCNGCTETECRTCTHCRVCISMQAYHFAYSATGLSIHSNVQSVIRLGEREEGGGRERERGSKSERGGERGERRREGDRDILNEEYFMHSRL